ncbi:MULTISPECIES: hypothetical protein [unclassified Mycobacterium]|uniref:hypothetical protein n=1 Tax=unclassified Mycobacterium TaxID=2642494 RepID=UPI0029C8B8FE|nr:MULTISPECIES: hypothetical protein [unclassified Mycobacterium]
MQALFVQMRDKVALIAEVFAVGLAFGDGRLTTAQASNAIGRAGLRSDVQQLDRAARVASPAPAGELVDAR